VSDLLYVYAVTRAGVVVTGAPPGLDDSAVRIVELADLAAVVSPAHGAHYAAHEVERRSEDVNWVAPRASAHDAVVTWLADRGPVIPLPMFTLFTDERRVREMLRQRANDLRATLERVAGADEFGLRVFRLEDVLLKHVATLSDRVETLERQAREATPGQRYLLERKLDTERRTEARRIALEVAGEAYASLVPHARESVREPLPAKAREDAAGVAVLNAYFLVERANLEPFQREVTSLVRTREAQGFRFDFTGPWPPYHFVRQPESAR
jgi:hypothetical protein